MGGSVNTITQDKTIANAVEQMVIEKTNSLIVVDGGKKPIGLFSTRNAIKAIVPEYLQKDVRSSIFDSEGTFEKYAKKAKDMQISECMYTEFHVLTDDDAMIEAAAHMLDGCRRIIPVVGKDSGEIVGSITRTCLKKALNDIFLKS